MHHDRRYARASWVLALVALVALVACSDDSSGSTTTVRTTTVTAPAGSVTTTSDTATSDTATSDTATSDTAGAAETTDGGAGTVAATDATATSGTATSGTTAASGTAGGGTATPGTVSSDFSVAASLRQIPRSALDGSDAGSATGNSSATSNNTTGTAGGGSAGDFVLVTGDLDEASKLAGVTRPKPGADAQDVVQWASAITGQRTGAGSSGVAIMPADAFELNSIAQADQIDDELGWSVLNVSTYVELQAPPQTFTAMQGHFDLQQLDAAQGDRDHGIWSLGGDDFSVDVAKVSPARPLGQALRSGVNKDGWLAQARSSQPIVDWIAAKNALDRDDGLEAVAKALDDQHVYSAMLVRSGFAPDPRATPAQAGTTLQPFDTLGVGSDHDDQGAILVLAYHSADEQDATANVALLRTMFTSGTSARTQQPWSQLLRLDDVQRNGKVVVVTLHLLDGRSPIVGAQAVAQHDTFATHV